MRVDFHLHTCAYSMCAGASPKAQMRAAVEAGVDAVFITEHMKLFPEKELDVLRKKFPELKIFQGIEVTVTDQGYDDFLVLGVHDEGIEKSNWRYNDLYEFVRKHNGVIILAHPYRFSDSVNPGVWENPPDAVEVLSSNIGRYDYQRRLLLAKELNCPIVTNSDSHFIENTGLFYNTFSWECYDEEDILLALKNGSYEGMTLV